MALPEIIDAADWSGGDAAKDKRWVYHLTPVEIDALRKMASQIRPALDGDANRLLTLEQDTFDLGDFAPKLAKIYTGLKSGHGMALVKGLPMFQLDPLDVATIYWGIGRHLGQATPNNPEGDMFGHITDLGKTQTLSLIHI